MAERKRDKMLRRWAALKDERSSWIDHWRDISEFIMPRTGRWLVTDQNKGNKRHNKIYDSSATFALRVLGAGMMSGATSPARPWFRLTTTDPEMTKYEPVKQWLNDTTRLMLDVFAKSNTYRALHSMYEELGAYGTAATIVEPNFKNIIHHHVLTAGEYAITTDDLGAVNTIYREFQMTVEQMVRAFGLENVSTTVRGMYERQNYDAWVSVIHAIEPRHDSEREYGKRDGKNMPFRSCYFEPGCDDGKYLRESGFKTFRGLAPRWSVTSGDIYGSSPAMQALGDIKGLQHKSVRKAEGIDYKTRPPLQVPMSMQGREVNRLPGGVTYVDINSPTGGIKSAFEVNLDLSHLLNDIADSRQLIDRAFYADLFMMIAQAPADGRMTATEVAERHEEKLLMLGPVLERLDSELFRPLIDMTFDSIQEAGALPPAPEELQGQDIEIEFVSMLAQAQRAVQTNSVDRLLGTFGSIAQFKPAVLDKLDEDAVIEDYADMLGANPRYIRPDEEVEAMRQARAMEQQKAQQSALAEQAANTQAKLGSIKTDQPNLLTDATAQFSGYQ